MNPLRITIVQGPFLPVPALLGGAIEKVWQTLSVEFAKRGHHVVHISRTFKGLPAREIREGVQHIRVPGYDAPSGQLKSKLFDLSYSMRACRQIPASDIIVTHTFSLPILLSLMHPRRGAIYVHAGRMPKGQMFLYTKAERVQTVSQAVAKEIVRQCPQLNDKVRVIPYFVPFELKNDLFTDYEKKRSPVILYTGRLHPEKGLDILLRAFNEVVKSAPEWRLRIVGPIEVKHGGGGEHYRQQLLSLASEKAKENIDWIGPIWSIEELNREYLQASVFVYPSIAEMGETFGVAPLEAMANGIPVVVSDLSCMRDFVRPGYNGFVFDHRAADKEKQLAKSLLDMITQPSSSRLDLAKNAAATARDYTIANVTDLYLADFAELLRSTIELEKC